MDQDQWKRNLEAATQLADWSKWLVTLETVGLAGLAGLLKYGTIKPFGTPENLFISLTIVCFALSIFNANSLLLRIPQLVQHRDFGGNVDVYTPKAKRLQTVTQIGRATGRYAVRQHYFFVIGIVCFVLATTRVASTTLDAVSNWRAHRAHPLADAYRVARWKNQ